MPEGRDLSAIYASWRRQPFPQGSEAQTLDELHTDLALADAWVAEYVVPFVEHGRFSRPEVEIIATLHKIRDRASDVAKSAGADGQALAAEYGRYVDLLEQLHMAYLSQAGPEPSAS